MNSLRCLQYNTTHNTLAVLVLVLAFHISHAVHTIYAYVVYSPCKPIRTSLTKASCTTKPENVSHCFHFVDILKLHRCIWVTEIFPSSNTTSWKIRTNIEITTLFTVRSVKTPIAFLSFILFIIFI